MEQASGDGTGRARRPDTTRLVVLLAIFVYSVLFIVLNSDKVKISFVFFTATTSLLVALLLAAVLGFVAGWMLHRSRARRSARR